MASYCRDENPEGVRKTYIFQNETNQQIIQGYDYEFVPFLDSKYECAICLMCQKDPVQTACGHRFCRECILTWVRKESYRCPEDNSSLTEQDIFPDNIAKREIASLKVKCPNSKSGCQVVVELGAVNEHKRFCEFETISCPNGCPITVLQQDLNDHVTKECLHRIIDCSLCYAQFHLYEQQSHFETCPMVSIPCPECGVNLTRKEHIQHLNGECPRAMCLCPFADVGCEVYIHMDLMQNHLNNYIHSHLRYLSLAHRKLSDFVTKLIGTEDAAGAGIPLIKLTHDALENLNLNHPFAQENAAVGLEAEAAGSGIKSLGVGTLGSVKPANTPSGGSTENLIKDLFQRNIQLEQRNREQEIKCLQLSQRLAEAETKLSFLEEQNSAAEGRFCNGVYVWRIPGISTLLAEANHSGHSKLLHSCGFYTGAFGYKVCLRANIISRSSASYLSLFIHFMQGDYDDTLEWPFRGVITLALLETKCPGSKGASILNHIEETMTTKPGLVAFQRPTSDRNPKGFGFTEFVSMDVVGKGFYLIEDTLTVKATVVFEPNLQYD